MQELVLRAQRGDQGAFESLMVAAHQRLFRVAFGIGASGHGATAVHLLQGEGAYAGQWAVVEVRLTPPRFDWEGYIVDFPFPQL